LLGDCPGDAARRRAWRGVSAGGGPAIAAGGRHRLYLSLPTTAAVGGVATTGAPVGQVYHAPRLDLRRRRRPRAGIWCHSPGSSWMRRSWRGVRRETGRQRCESCNGPPANRRQQQRGAQEVRYKTWKYQKDSADHRCHARRFQMQGSNPVPGEGGAQAVEIGASAPSEQQHARDGRGAAIRKKETNPAAGSTSSPINAPFAKHIGLITAVVLAISLVGARVGIVYGPEGATGAGGSAQASGSVGSRTYILVWEPISAYADFLSAGFPLIRGSRHGGRERARRVRYLHHHLS